MDIRRAVITAAARSHHTLPLQTLVDRDGAEKSALQVLVEEALDAGVEEVGVVIAPGDGMAYAAAAGPYAPRLHFMEQVAPRGYGHALALARDFARGEPVLHLISDHLYLSRQARRCARQVVDRARAEKCAVSAVQATHESKLPYYGTVGGRRVTGQDDLYEVDTVIEKPTPTEAEQRLLVSGLRAGHYLCFFGIHVLTPAVFDLLAAACAAAPDARVELSPVLAALPGRERYLALEVHGARYNMGVKYGLLTAQLALALDGADRENVLAGLLELLAHRTRAAS